MTEIKKTNGIFGWMARLLIFIAAGGTLSVHASAAPASERFAISPNRVSQALQQAGVSAKSAQVEFLSPVSSIGEYPRLVVVNVAQWRNGNLKALLRCQNHRECLPFYVVLRDQQMVEGSRNFLNAAPTDARVKQKTRNKSTGKLLVRGGQPAMLILRNQNLRITLPVICLENGERGEIIRLSSPDRKQKYAGEVVQAGLLEGTFR